MVTEGGRPRGVRSERAGDTWLALQRLISILQASAKPTSILFMSTSPPLLSKGVADFCLIDWRILRSGSHTNGRISLSMTLTDCPTYRGRYIRNPRWRPRWVRQTGSSLSRTSCLVTSRTRWVPLCCVHVQADVSKLSHGSVIHNKHRQLNTSLLTRPSLSITYKRNVTEIRFVCYSLNHGRIHINEVFRSCCGMCIYRPI